MMYDVDYFNPLREQFEEELTLELYDIYKSWSNREVYDGRMGFYTTYMDEYFKYNIETENFDPKMLNLEGVEGLSYDEAVEKFGQELLDEEIDEVMWGLCSKASSKFVYGD